MRHKWVKEYGSTFDDYMCINCSLILENWLFESHNSTPHYKFDDRHNFTILDLCFMTCEQSLIKDILE